MIRLQIIFLTFLFYLFLTSFLHSANSSNSFPGQVFIGVYDNPPKITLGTKGQVTGFWPDLIRYIAEKENWQIRYVPGTWEEGIEKLRKGEIDMMPDVAYTAERAKLYHYSQEPILVSWTRTYTAKDNKEILSITDLDNCTVGALSGSVNLEGESGLRDLARKFDLNIDVAEYQNYQSVFQDIENGRIDAGITNRNFGDEFADDYQVQATPIIFQPINMKFAFPRKSVFSLYLADRINFRIDELKRNSDSYYFQLLSMYFESEIAEKPIEIVPHWVNLSLEFGLGIILFLAAVMFAARVQIKRQTKKIQLQNKALAAEKERLQVTMNSIGDGVIATDCDGVVILMNEIAGQLTGWSQKNAVGRLLSDIFRIADSFSGKILESPVDLVLTSGKSEVMANHTTLIAKNGVRKNISDSAAPIFDAENQIIGVILVFRDVTEKLKNEAALMKIKKLESLGVLAGGIAHDFNNILAAVMGNIELAGMSVDMTGPAYPLLQEAKRASIRATDLTQQLLTFSKGGEPVKETTSIAAVITESADFVLHGSSVTCQFDIQEDLWLVEIDPGQISQVIQNLVINAKHALPEGGKIIISCKNVPFLHTLDAIDLPDRPFIEIVVEDNGCGIAGKYLEKIFDPYFTTKQEGSGLGLAITHSIISKHGGFIDVRSDPGKGTVFLIYLPASEKQTKKDRMEFPYRRDGKNFHILIMDDDEFVRDVAKKMITRLGHSVSTASDGNEAIHIYRENLNLAQPIDLIIMDLTIPGGLGGKEAVQKILDINPEAKVIVASGYSNDPVMSHYPDYGFAAAITKPFTTHDLVKKINEVMG